MPAILRMRSFAVLAAMLVTALLASMFTAVTPSADAATLRERKVHRAVDIVRNQKGDPYRYGAAGPGAFDCSGLVYFSFRKAGFRHVPRTSRAQARFAKRIKRSRMRRGDLMFFHNGGRVYHVGVFAGWKNGRRMLIHAPSTGKRVHRSAVWTNRWYPGTIR
jgi:cell wall-associated NlpC family hydrolase